MGSSIGLKIYPLRLWCWGIFLLPPCSHILDFCRRRGLWGPRSRLCELGVVGGLLARDLVARRLAYNLLLAIGAMAHFPPSSFPLRLSVRFPNFVSWQFPRYGGTTVAAYADALFFLELHTCRSRAFEGLLGYFLLRSSSHYFKFSLFGGKGWIRSPE